MYTTVPCRPLDTRTISTGTPITGTLADNIATSSCGIPASAQAYVLNATVVPAVPSIGLSYLTLWPNGQMMPVVSTLNALDGAITSNMAIPPTSNGWVNAFATSPTQLILDLSGYFAP